VLSGSAEELTADHLDEGAEDPGINAVYQNAVYQSEADNEVINAVMNAEDSNRRIIRVAFLNHKSIRFSIQKYLIISNTGQRLVVFTALHGIVHHTAAAETTSSTCTGCASSLSAHDCRTVLILGASHGK